MDDVENNRSKSVAIFEIWLTYSKIQKYVYSSSVNKSPPPLARFLTSPLRWCISNYGFYYNMVLRDLTNVFSKRSIFSFLLILCLTAIQEFATIDINQGNCQFWNPNPLGLGGKTALLERTKALIFSLTLGPKL